MVKSMSVFQMFSNQIIVLCLSQHQERAVVYFDQLQGAALTQKLVKTFLSRFSTFFVFLSEKNNLKNKDFTHFSQRFLCIQRLNVNPFSLFLTYHHSKVMHSPVLLLTTLCHMFLSTCKMTSCPCILAEALLQKTRTNNTQ